MSSINSPHCPIRETINAAAAAAAAADPALWTRNSILQPSYQPNRVLQRIKQEIINNSSSGGGSSASSCPTSSCSPAFENTQATPDSVIPPHPRPVVANVARGYGSIRDIEPSVVAFARRPNSPTSSSSRTASSSARSSQLTFHTVTSVSVGTTASPLGPLGDATAERVQVMKENETEDEEASASEGGATQVIEQPAGESGGPLAPNRILRSVRAFNENACNATASCQRFDD